MNPSSFSYIAPMSLDEAFEFLSSHEDEAKILAGGQSLIPLLKLRLTSIPYIVDISGIDGMNYIRESQSDLRIGSLTTIADLEDSDLIHGKYQIISDAASGIADPLVRNRGTIGGNITHGDPSNDIPAVMLAMGASFILASNRSERKVNAENFFLDTFTTAIEYGEILTEIVIPKAVKRSGGCYIKNKKAAGDFSVAAIAVYLNLRANGTVEKAGIGLTSVGPKPSRALKTEKYLKDRKIDDAVAKEAAAITVTECEPSSDFYGTAEFKKKVLEKITAEAILVAAERSEEN
ncbi:MAG: xanthine dehydrogenase family protein subunit M [Thermoplasmataceae archaeon]